LDEISERGENDLQNRSWLNDANDYHPSPMLAALALPGILDPFRDSVGTIFQTSCSSSKPITDSFSCISCRGCDCVANASTSSTSYTTCAKSESISLVSPADHCDLQACCSETLAMLARISTHQQCVQVRQ
jgi:hypothetical protein